MLTFHMRPLGLDHCENILNSVLSYSSHFSPGIQLADLVPHSVFCVSL